MGWTSVRYVPTALSLPAELGPSFTKSRATTPPEVHPITTISLHYPYHISLSVQ